MKQVLPSYKTYFQAIILWLGLLWLGGLSAQVSGVENEGNKVNQCPNPTFSLAEPIPTGNIRISWQGNPKHNKYHVQYRKQGAVGSSSVGSGQSAVGRSQ